MSSKIAQRSLMDNHSLAMIKIYIPIEKIMRKTRLVKSIASTVGLRMKMKIKIIAEVE